MRLGIQRFFALIVLTAFASTVAAKEIGTSKPERQGYSSERLAKITEFMDAKVDDGTMVGGMGVIMRNGKIIYQQDLWSG